MKRDLEKVLREWKTAAWRIPLLLRGARQVGKTTLIEQFGRAEFEQTVTLNFEL